MAAARVVAVRPGLLGRGGVLALPLAVLALVLSGVLLGPRRLALLGRDADHRDLLGLRGLVALLVGHGVRGVRVQAGRLGRRHRAVRAPVRFRGRGVVRREFGQVLEEFLALAVDVADGDEGGVGRHALQQGRHELVGRPPLTTEVDGAVAPLGRDGVDGALGGVTDDEHVVRLEVGDDLAHLPVALHAVGPAVDHDVQRPVDRSEVEQLVDVHQRRLGVVGREDVGEGELLALGRHITLDGQHARVRRGVVHALQGDPPFDAEQFGHDEGDRDVLLEGEPAEAAQLLVGDGLRVGVDQLAVTGVGLFLEDVEALLLGGDADAVLRHGAAQRARHVVEGGAHLGEVVLADVAQHADRGADQLALVHLLQGRHDGHALDDEGVGPVGGGPAHDADLLHHVGDAELAVDRLLGGVGVDEPGRRSRGLRHGDQVAAAQRPGAQPGDGGLAADAVDEHTRRDAVQAGVVPALFHDPRHEQQHTAGEQDEVQIEHGWVTFPERRLPAQRAGAPGSAYGPGVADAAVRGCVRRRPPRPGSADRART